MEIKLFFTVPTAFLARFENMQEFYFIEAEIARKDNTYRDYWVTMRKENPDKYMILDNSAYLMDKPMDVKTLEKILNFYKPDCVIAPDYPYDWVKTLKATEDFAEGFGHFDTQIMGVPQGKAYNEYMSCFYRMVENPQIDVIGINMFMDWPNMRQSGLDKTEQCCRLREMVLWQIGTDVRSYKKAVHILGITTGREIPFCVKHNLDYVKSCDSSSAFVHGYNGIRYTEAGIEKKLWDTKLDFSNIKEVNEQQEEDIAFNVNMLRKMRKERK